MNPRLFHVSDRADIRCFEPRMPPSPDSGIHTPVVWAIGQRLLHNYLLPRNCPRVCFYGAPDTCAQDIDRFMVGTSAGHVVAVESGWMQQLRAHTLWQYEMPGDAFEPVRGRASGAEYYVAHRRVWPLAVTQIDDIAQALAQSDVELRVMPSLWKLHDAVAASTLQFSMIRMRHAQPRDGQREAQNECASNDDRARAVGASIGRSR